MHEPRPDILGLIRGAGNVIELHLRIDSVDATAVGVKILCAPDGSEQTAISYLPGEQKLQVDFRQSSLAKDLQYWDYDPVREEAFDTAGTVQAAPFRLAAGEPLELCVHRPIRDRGVRQPSCVTIRYRSATTFSTTPPRSSRRRGRRALRDRKAEIFDGKGLNGR